MIRAYTDNDKIKLTEIIRLNTPEFFAVTEEAEFMEYLDHRRDVYFVVEDAGNVVGAGGINYMEDGKTARISWDLFHPDVQGKGLGSKLLQHRIDTIKNSGKASVICVRTSQVVFRFYEKNGFKLVKVEKDFWAKGFDLYQMEIHL